MSRRLRCLTSILTCSLILSCSGTEPVDAPDWVTYNTLNSNLHDNRVRAIAIGGDGNPWVVYPGGGLGHLESRGWTTYIDSGSILGRIAVYSITVDSESIVWTGNAAGVARLAGTHWTRFSGSDTYRGIFAHATAVDSNGNVWFGGWGLAAQYDGTNWRTYDTANSALFPGTIYDIAVDGKGAIWFCGVAKSRDPPLQPPTQSRVSRYDGNTWIIYDEEDGLPRGGLYSIAADPDGSIWVGSGDGEVGHLTDSSWVRYTSDETSLSSAHVYDIAVDTKGVRWFATGFGLTRFDGVTWTTFTTANSGLGDNAVRAIVVDRENRKWIGTSGGGVSRLTD